MAEDRQARFTGSWTYRVYCAVLLPLPAAYLVGMVFCIIFWIIGLAPENLPRVLLQWGIATIFLQLLVGYPLSKLLRGRSALPHLLTGLAIAILVAVLPGIMQFGGSATGVDRTVYSSDLKAANTVSTHGFQGESVFMPSAQMTGTEFAKRIAFLGVPVMMGYFLLYYFCTHLPERRRANPHRIERDLPGEDTRNLKGEIVGRGRVVKRRSKRKFRQIV